MKWRRMESAPVEKSVVVWAGGMAFCASLRICDYGPDDPSYAWVADRLGIHPPCWTDGRCWGSNEHNEPSARPLCWTNKPEAKA